jgi:hypothetical protein
VQWTAALITTTAGVTGIGAAAIAGTGAIVAKSENRIDEARGWARAFDWIAVPGAASLAAGVTLFLLMPPPLQHHSLRIVPVVGAGTMRVEIASSF